MNGEFTAPLIYVFSRRCVGSIADHLPTDMVVDAIDMRDGAAKPPGPSFTPTAGPDERVARLRHQTHGDMRKASMDVYRRKLSKLSCP